MRIGRIFLKKLGISMCPLRVVIYHKFPNHVNIVCTAHTFPPKLFIHFHCGLLFTNLIMYQ